MKRKNHFIYKYLLLCCSIIVIVTLFSAIFYSNSQKILNDSVKSQLVSNLKGAALYIDVDLHRDLRKAYEALGKKQYELLVAEEMLVEDKIMYGFSSNEYLKMRSDLVQYADEIGAEFIYTINYIDEYFYFVIDTDEENPSYIGEGYEGLGENEIAFFKGVFTNDGEIEIHQISDSYGDYVTGSVILYDSLGNPETLLCVDLTSQFLLVHRNTFIITTILLNSTLTITFAIIGYVLFRLLKRNADMQQKIEMMAYYDSLTSLPNRVSLIERLEQMIKDINEGGATHSLALCFIDLDNFKRVNDHEGHVCGDILLQQVAQFLREHSNVRPLLKSKCKDFVARLGGDEFVIIYPTENKSVLIELIEKIFVDFEKIKSQDQIMSKYNISLSIGVSLYPEYADCISNLLRTADTAMYVAKNAGKGKYVLFDKSMESHRKY